jgi:hypothetical protein
MLNFLKKLFGKGEVVSEPTPYKVEAPVSVVTEAPKVAPLVVETSPGFAMPIVEQEKPVEVEVIPAKPVAITATKKAKAPAKPKTEKATKPKESKAKPKPAKKPKMTIAK